MDYRVRQSQSWLKRYSQLDHGNVVLLCFCFSGFVLLKIFKNLFI